MIIHCMKDEDWAIVRHFNKDEDWGKPNFMSVGLIFELDRLREYVGRRIKIHCGYSKGKGHTKNSQHYLIPCTAVDFHIEGLHPIDQFIVACRFNFNGIGFYPAWNSPGLHAEQNESRHQRGFWWRDKNGKYRDISAFSFKEILDTELAARIWHEEEAV